MLENSKNIEKTTVEKTKADFSLEALMDARSKTYEALDRISKAITIGMREEDATRIATQIMTEMGAEKFWHRTYVRFGTNTLKKYSQASDPGVTLGENDIYYLDIGPVWNGYEGDVGDTYVTGNDPEMHNCAKDCRAIFEAVKTHWKETSATGQALYDYASQIAEKMGWKLNLNVAGHRLSDFPHALYSKLGLDKVDFHPSSHVWVLEIQIQHPSRPFGAFYEDLLY